MFLKITGYVEASRLHWVADSGGKTCKQFWENAGFGGKNVEKIRKMQVFGHAGLC